jgi:hypothetical protein
MMSFNIQSVSITPRFINVLNQLFTGLNFVEKDEKYFFFSKIINQNTLKFRIRL